MKTQADKTQESQNSITPRVTSEPSDGGTAQLVDNRTSTIDQQKLRTTMNASTENSTNPLQLKASPERSRRANNTGLPDNLKSGVENLSGYSMDDVKVHYNSSKPAQLQAHAYAQGTDIHLAPGQQKHLPHEAWHVVQQKQGRVKPTMQFKGKVNINDNTGLEKEADVMGAKALRGGILQEGRSLSTTELNIRSRASSTAQLSVIQCEFGDELQREIDTFIERLDDLIAESEAEHGGAFRFIEVDALLEGAPAQMAEGLLLFLNNGDTATGSVMAEWLIEELKKKFGYDQVADLKNMLLKRLGWGNLKFKTKGQNLKYFMENPRNRNVRDAMRAKLTGYPDPEGKLKELITSGWDAPTIKQVQPGDTFYKLMKPGEDFKSTHSTYYVSWDELQIILGGEHLADHLGLPLINYQAVYCVYEIKARQPTQVFQSTIAQTEQRIPTSNTKMKNSGGRQQTLILDSNSANWEKIERAKYLLDPNEIELMRLAELQE